MQFTGVPCGQQSHRGRGKDRGKLGEFLHRQKRQPPLSASQGCFSEMEIFSGQMVHFSRETLNLDFYMNHQILKPWQHNPMFKTQCMQVKTNPFVDL